MLQKPRNQTSC